MKYAYKIANGRYIAETIGNDPAGDYISNTQIDCTKYAPDEAGAPVLIPVPEPVEPPAPYVPTAAEIQAGLVAAVQAHLDASAKARGYDNILSAVTYAGDAIVPQFDIEGQAYKTWRTQVWAYCYAYLAEVQAGTKAVPTAPELIALLPVPPAPIEYVMYGNNA